MEPLQIFGGFIMLYGILTLLFVESIQLTSYNTWRPLGWIRADCRQLVISNINPGEPVVAGGR